MSEPLLRVDGIDVSYGDVQVLYGLSLEVREGEIVTLLGSNGAGKTTTLRAISGISPPARGRHPLPRASRSSRLPAAARAELGIALVPEGRDLWTQLTVRENLELGAYHPRARASAARNLEQRVRDVPSPARAERRSSRAASPAASSRCAPSAGRS